MLPLCSTQGTNWAFTLLFLSEDLTRAALYCYPGCAGVELPGQCAAWRQAGPELFFPLGADSPKARLTPGVLGSVSCWYLQVISDGAWKSSCPLSKPEEHRTS